MKEPRVRPIPFGEIYCLAWVLQDGIRVLFRGLLFQIKVHNSEGSLFRRFVNPNRQNTYSRGFLNPKMKLGALFRRFVKPKMKKGSLFQGYTLIQKL